MDDNVGAMGMIREVKTEPIKLGRMGGYGETMSESDKSKS